MPTRRGLDPIDVQAIGASLMSLSPHRFYGPKGVGVLYRNRRARLVSILHGGVQENGRRAGTENVPAIVGAGVAAEIALRDLGPRRARRRLQRRLWDGLKSRIPYIKLNGPEPGPDRICNNINISTEFIEGEGQLLLLDLHGIAVASGSSCVSKSLKISHVLAAIGLDHALAQGNLILTLGKDNSAEDIDYVVEAFAKIVEKLRGMSPMWEEFQHGIIDSVIAVPPAAASRSPNTPPASPAKPPTEPPAAPPHLPPARHPPRRLQGVRGSLRLFAPPLFPARFAPPTSGLPSRPSHAILTPHDFPGPDPRRPQRRSNTPGSAAISSRSDWSRTPPSPTDPPPPYCS
jgi:hypothetical protein